MLYFIKNVFTRRFFSTKSIQIISDLHTEFHRQPVKLTNFINVKSKNLAILGDLGNLNKRSIINYKDIVCQSSNLFEKVFIVSGNHEYYRYTNDQILSMDDTDKKIEDICNYYPNVYFLNNKSVKLYDYLICGSTLWSNVTPFKVNNEPLPNDYRQIYDNDKKLITINHILKLFNNNVSWLQHQIESNKKDKIIIMTHHMPSYQLVAEKYKNHYATCAFASSLEHLFRQNVKYYFCGHTHVPMYKQINNCKIFINPWGYSKEHKSRKNTNSDIVVDLD